MSRALMREFPPRWRLPLFAGGFVSLAVGVLAGLARLGWPVPDTAAAAAGLHGPLMTAGFFGTVIGLERAVALRHPLAYAGPLCSALGGTAMAFGLAAVVAPWLMVAAAAVLVAGSLQVLRVQRADFTVTLALAAGAWLAGNLLWAAGQATAAVLPGWMAFLVLTIAGERLELSRMLPRPPGAARLFAAIVAAMLGALLATALAAAWGPRLFGAVLLALAAWLLRHDIARRTVKQTGLARYIAVCLLSGYAWLAAGALVALAADAAAPGSRAYDAHVHAVMLGFVFSMVLGHAPIIFPAVMRVRLAYHPAFYLPLALLHGSLALRLAGDALDAVALRRAGALGNAVALAAFIATMAAAAWRGRGAAAAR